FGGDAGRMALMGHSAGAYCAAMLALEPSHLGALRGRVRVLVGVSGPYDFYPFDVAVTRRTFGAVPEPERTQPVNLVSAAAPPAFLATGDADKLVYPRNTVALAQRLRDAGIAVDERHYPGLSHAQTL